MAILDSDSRVSVHGTITVTHHFRSKAFADKEGNLPNNNLLEVCKVLKSMTGFKIERDNSKLLISLADVQIDNSRKTACILINTTNKRGAATVVNDTETNKREVLALKKASHGYEASCHIFLSLEAGVTGTYQFAAEVIPKLNSGRITSLLNNLLNEASKKYPVYYSLDKDFARATKSTLKSHRVPFKTRLDLTFDQDEQFFEDLKDGVISSVKLIRHERSTFSFADRGDVITAKKFSLDIETSRERANQIDWIKGVSRSRLGRRFDQIAFSFDAEEGQRSAVFNLKNIKLDGLEKALTKKSYLTGFSFPLQDAYTKIYPEIQDKLKDAMGL